MIAATVSCRFRCIATASGVAVSTSPLRLARHLAKAAGKPLLAGTLLRVKPTERQVGLSALARQDNVRGAFAIAPGRKTDVYGKRVVLVDDVYTTGATVGAASRVLRKAGATDVTVLTFAMAISGPI